LSSTLVLTVILVTHRGVFVGPAGKNVKLEAPLVYKNNGEAVARFGVSVNGVVGKVLEGQWIKKVPSFHVTKY